MLFRRSAASRLPSGDRLLSTADKKEEKGGGRLTQGLGRGLRYFAAPRLPHNLLVCGCGPRAVHFCHLPFAFSEFMISSYFFLLIAVNIADVAPTSSVNSTSSPGFRPVSICLSRTRKLMVMADMKPGMA